MRLDDTRKPPLWVEQGEEIYGDNLTPSELLAEELDARPSLRLLLGGRASNSPAHGADRPVTPTHPNQPAATERLLTPGGGPDLDSAA